MDSPAYQVTSLSAYQPPTLLDFAVCGSTPTSEGFRSLPVTICLICNTSLAFLDLFPSPEVRNSLNHFSSVPLSAKLASSLPLELAVLGSAITDATSRSNSCCWVCSGYDLEKARASRMLVWDRAPNRSSIASDFFRTG